MSDEIHNSVTGHLKAMDEMFPFLSSIVWAEEGKVVEARIILKELIRKLRDGDGMQEYEKEYLVRCLLKITENGENPYDGDPFNLLTKKGLNAPGAAGSKWKKQILCHEEFERLKRHHNGIMSLISGVDDGTFILGQKSKLQYVKKGRKYEDQFLLDYSKKLSNEKCCEIVSKLLLKKYKIALGEDSVLTYYSAYKLLIKNK